jgi:phosphoribosylaminoimidazole-succinocarboxamide synthase
MAELLELDLPGARKLRSGKVRELFDLGEELLMVTTDRLSAFDVVMANGVPGKGRALNGMSAFWFERLASIVPHHMITPSDAEVSARLGRDDPRLRGRAMVVRRADPIPVECVVRGCITGSLFKEYLSSGGTVHGLDLPPGLRDGDRLPQPVFTPATKAESGHDRNIGFDEVVDAAGGEVAGWLRDTALRLYAEAASYAATRGLILADTKFEFGLTPDGPVWIDEALTPDSSRYWDAALWSPGGPQPGFDKQSVRDWLEASGWDKRPPGPRLPEDVVAKTRAKYLEAYARIVGRELPPA